MSKASIKLNSNTRGHVAILRDKGYSVEEEEDYLLVEIEGEVCSGLVNLTTEEGRAYVKDLIAGHGCFTYKTNFLLPGEERTHSGIFALRKIGALSAFVMKPEVEKKQSTSLDKDLITDLLS